MGLSQFPESAHFSGVNFSLLQDEFFNSVNVAVLIDQFTLILHCPMLNFMCGGGETND